MSNDHIDLLRGLNGDPYATSGLGQLGRAEYQRQRRLKDQRKRPATTAQEPHPLGSGYRSFRTTEKLIENMPGAVILLFSCLGAIVAIAAVHIGSPAIVGDILALEAGWLAWLAFPAAAIGGFLAGHVALAGLIYAIDWLLQAAIMVAFAVGFLGLLYWLFAM